MASSRKHHQQYESNREFIEEMLDSPNPKNDWIVTAAFYSALHLVDKKLIDVGGDTLKPKDHMNRNDKVGKLSCFKSVRRYYSALYMDSRKSRYDCVVITNDKRNESIKYLEEIEKKLNL